MSARGHAEVLHPCWHPVKPGLAAGFFFGESLAAWAESGDRACDVALPCGVVETKVIDLS
jgi:hypothetical protein